MEPWFQFQDRTRSTPSSRESGLERGFHLSGLPLVFDDALEDASFILVRLVFHLSTTKPAKAWFDAWGLGDLKRHSSSYVWDLGIFTAEFSPLLKIPKIPIHMSVPSLIDRMNGALRI